MLKYKGDLYAGKRAGMEAFPVGLTPWPEYIVKGGGLQLLNISSKKYDS